MPLIDPCETRAVPKDLIAQFLDVFARCEFAMKETAYVRYDHGIAAAARQRLANDTVSWVELAHGDELDAAICALTTDPPLLQAFGGGWQAVPLPAAHRVAQAVNAAVRARNNLFHSGKYTPEAAPGRDELLVRAALTVLTAVVEHCPRDLPGAFNHG
jgi:hypothetical protein